MMLMSQCATFQAWMAPIYPKMAGYGWTPKKKICDLVETTDLLDFQTFTNLIQVYGPQTYLVPNVTGTGVPLSTILVAHHNLVTYGVPFEWVRPKPSNKRYYSPETAVQKLAGSKLFSGDGAVQAWYAQKRSSLEPSPVEDVPGMAKWVSTAQVCWAEEGDSTHGRCAGDWYQMWKNSHSDVPPEVPGYGVPVQERGMER